MRKKLLKLLRAIEKGDGLKVVAPRSFSDEVQADSTSEDYELFLRSQDREQRFKNEYTKYSDDFQCFYATEEFLDFPNYRFIIRKFSDKYIVVDENDRFLPVTRNAILAELSRMEADGLIMIDVQEGAVYASPERGKGPDEEGRVTCEKVVLTTKGKSKLGYFLYQMEEQRFSVYALFLSFISVAISVWTLLYTSLL